MFVSFIGYYMNSNNSPLPWHSRLSGLLLDLGFHGSRADTSLFVKWSGDHVVLLLVYVDNIVLTGSSHTLVDVFVHDLHTNFAMKVLGPLHYFLGIEATLQNGSLHLSQHKFARELLIRLNMDGAKPIFTLVTTGSKMTKYAGTPLPDATSYRVAVGALQYLTLTRPDIQFAVNQACQFQHCPTDIHWTAVKQILGISSKT